jgi:hypothetical protein
MLVSIPVNGNKGRASDTFTGPHGDLPFPAERTVQAVPVFKYPDIVPG